MFKYSLVSDLHLDFPHPKTPPLEKFVIVAGDTGNGLIGLKYLNKLKRKGHIVFAVDGNHEHYRNESKGRTIPETEVSFYEQLSQPRILDLPDRKTRLVGANGWYEVRDEEHWLRYMNDGRYGNTSAREITEKAYEHSNFIYDSVRDAPDGWKVIVVTHTSPHPSSLDPRYIGSDINQYFFNPWMERTMIDLRDRIHFWHHGHTHAFRDGEIYGVRVIANPRGYPRENPNWRPLTMEV